MKQISIWLAHKAGKKITRKQITRTLTYSKSAANALGLSKQDNTNSICAAGFGMKRVNVGVRGLAAAKKVFHVCLYH